MREILFSGKIQVCFRHLDYLAGRDGDWIKGIYIRGGSKPFINSVLVIPETVGEYTGLKDKNGKRIFEGDIIADETTIFEVKWQCAQWFFVRAAGFYQSPTAYSNADRMGIIGNIHDNPELLRRREMTLKEAIDLSLEVWRYLAAHPGISKKSGLPDKLYRKIKDMDSRCPLCEYKSESYTTCYECPLCFSKTGDRINCNNTEHPYREWFIAETEKARREAATAIVKLLEAALEKENRNEKSN
jgi:hypothetical protein